MLDANLTRTTRKPRTAQTARRRRHTRAASVWRACALLLLRSSASLARARARRCCCAAAALLWLARARALLLRASTPRVCRAIAPGGGGGGGGGGGPARARARYSTRAKQWAPAARAPDALLLAASAEERAPLVPQGIHHNASAAPAGAARSSSSSSSSDRCHDVQPSRRHALVVEGNVVAACAIFASSIAFDALNALPTTVVADVPVSLRTTSLVLVALIAAPPIESHFLFEQRALACVLLAFSAWGGLHHGGPNARVADATYCLLGGWATILIYGISGPKQGERGYDGRGRRENAVALASGFLGYAGLRIVRASVSHAAEVVQFSVSDQDVFVRGYALADDLVAAALGFGGVICISAAMIILANHDLVYERGCTPVCRILGMLSVFVFTAAFVVQIASYARLEEMSALFGEASCTGLRDVCEMTYRSRRMYSSNSSPATLWACAVGLTIFAFPHEGRCRTRRDYYCTHEDENASVEASRAAGWLAILSAFVAIVAVWYFSDGTSTVASIELLLLYFSIPAGWFGDTTIACTLHAAGIAVYTISRLGTAFGFDLTYLTHWNVAATLLITLMLAFTTGISKFLYVSCCSRERYVVWIEYLTVTGLVALLSMQLSLTIGALGIVSGYEGSAFGDSSRGWRVTSFEWATQHCISFFFAAALVGGRYECRSPCVSRWCLKAIWFSVPIVLVVAWIVAMIVVDSPVPYAATGDVLSLGLSALAAIVPWIVVGNVVC